MAEDGKKIAIGVGIAGAIAGVIYLLTRAKPPPKKYPCPYCPATFDNYEDLVTHVLIDHPGERVPIDIIWE